MNYQMDPTTVNDIEFDIDEGYITERIKGCDLFIGIYGKSYGKGQFPSTDPLSEPLSLIDLELNIALKHLKPHQIIIFRQNLEEEELDERLKSMFLPFKQFNYFEREIDLILDLQTQIKIWLDSETILASKEVTSNQQLLSITLRGKDQTGLLVRIFKVIVNLGGNVIQAKQDVYSKIATSRIISEWTLHNILEDRESLKMQIIKELGGLYGQSKTLEIDLIIDELKSYEGDVRSKTRLKVEFFDGRGIAERIFRELSNESLNVLESNFQQVTANVPIIGEFIIVFDSTESDKKKIDNVAEKIRKCPGVIRVERIVMEGNWWYNK
ncbi:MAG: ACT domain-containing protein [Saprospiraceae bacterium]